MTFDLRKVTKEMIKALSRMEGNFLTWWIVCTLTIDLVVSQQLDYIQVNLSVGKLRGSRRRENYDMGTGEWRVSKVSFSFPSITREHSSLKLSLKLELDQQRIYHFLIKIL